MAHTKQNNFFKDLNSSIVVFLVALPLCMGIALASGVPIEKGLISGIIGGLIVGTFSGAPLQVSGPAAGLAVMIYEIVQTYGLKALVPLGIICGLAQMSAGVFKLGRYFQATSPSLIKGMLSGIGALILLSQVHVLLGQSSFSSGTLNLTNIPNSLSVFFSGLSLSGTEGSNVIFESGLIGLITLGALVLFEKVPRLRLVRQIPSALYAIVVAVIGTQLLGIGPKMINLPSNILSFDFSQVATSGSFFADITFWLKAIGVAFIASAETLLCVSAVDRMQSETLSNYDKEIFAQGLGNMVAGFFGAIPITGVIVRSAANVTAGAKGRTSAILHGVWLILMVAIFPEVLQLVPLSSLAAILVFTGIKLLDFKSMLKLHEHGKSEMMIFIATFGGVVFVDLLTGVVVGFGLSVLMLLARTATWKIFANINVKTVGNTSYIEAKGFLSFFGLPRLAQVLTEQLETNVKENDSSLKDASTEGNAIKKGQQKVVVDLSSVNYIDWACSDYIKDWVPRAQSRGIQIETRLSVDIPSEFSGSLAS